MKDLNIVIITGLSGSGKSTAIDALEDVGYFCVDNMPVVLLPKFLQLRSGSMSEVQKLALGMDLREKEFLQKYQAVFGLLREKGYHLKILFLEASEEALLNRYSQTRRQHPVSKEGRLLESIRTEKEQLQGLKAIADRVIDTSQYTVHQLKESIIHYAHPDRKSHRMQMGIVSFGFKYGIPLETDLLMDVRFIPNPYFIPELQKLDGKDPRVKAFVTKWQETHVFLEKYYALIDYLLPLFEKEGKSYLTISVGCTGGRHRSVTIAEEIFHHLKAGKRELSLTHRDIELG
jgi:UPF0042 nucleotide-binding protein